jgi:hypothetical protein
VKIGYVIPYGMDLLGTCVLSDALVYCKSSKEYDGEQQPVKFTTRKGIQSFRKSIFLQLVFYSFHPLK